MKIEKADYQNYFDSLNEVAKSFNNVVFCSGGLSEIKVSLSWPKITVNGQIENGGILEQFSFTVNAKAGYFLSDGSIVNTTPIYCDGPCGWYVGGKRALLKITLPYDKFYVEFLDTGEATFL